jgi:hypothetical protein
MLRTPESSLQLRLAGWLAMDAIVEARRGGIGLAILKTGLHFS